MRRREFVIVLGSVILSAPLPLRAQPARRPRLGILLYSAPDRDPNTQAFMGGLRDLGYVAGQNIDIEIRFADGKPERLAGLAAELVQVKPDAIYALGGDVTPWAAKATQTIPLVYAISVDPVQIGLAQSLSKPGGNATGVTFLSDQLAAKRLEVFKQAAPGISNIGFLHDPSHADNEEPVTRRAATALGVQMQPVPMRGPAEIDRALDNAVQSKVDALYVVSSRHTTVNAAHIVAFALKNRLPLVGGWGAWVENGGLLSYGPNVSDMIRQSATYVDKVLKGTRTTDLPVQQPTRFELQVNLKTAKALGLNIPEPFLLLADKVIE